MATIAENLNLIENEKAEIKDAVASKGVDMTSVPFTGYAEKIATIPSVLNIQGVQQKQIKLDSSFFPGNLIGETTGRLTNVYTGGGGLQSGAKAISADGKYISYGYDQIYEANMLEGPHGFQYEMSTWNATDVPNPPISVQDDRYAFLEVDGITYCLMLQFGAVAVSGYPGHSDIRLFAYLSGSWHRIQDGIDVQPSFTTSVGNHQYCEVRANTKNGTFIVTCPVTGTQYGIYTYKVDPATQKVKQKSSLLVSATSPNYPFRPKIMTTRNNIVFFHFAPGTMISCSYDQNGVLIVYQTTNILSLYSSWEAIADIAVNYEGNMMVIGGAISSGNNDIVQWFTINGAVGSYTFTNVSTGKPEIRNLTTGSGGGYKTPSQMTLSPSGFLVAYYGAGGGNVQKAFQIKDTLAIVIDDFTAVPNAFETICSDNGSLFVSSSTNGAPFLYSFSPQYVKITDNNWSLAKTLYSVGVITNKTDQNIYDASFLLY